MKPRADFQWSVSLALIVVTLVVYNEALANGVFTSKNIAPKESYELDYLGCKLEADPNSTKRIGIFQLTWKADAPTKLLVDVSQDGKKVDPVIDFVVHIEPGTVPFKGTYSLPPGGFTLVTRGLRNPAGNGLPFSRGRS